MLGFFTFTFPFKFEKFEKVASWVCNLKNLKKWLPGYVIDQDKN